VQEQALVLVSESAREQAQAPVAALLAVQAEELAVESVSAEAPEVE
jgi:hypothetical protein